MKKKARVKQQRAFRAMLAQRYAVGIALAFSAGFAVAADEDTTSFEGPEDAGSNWIELGFGNMSVRSGNQAQAEQQLRHSEGPFAGIEDLHYQKDVAKGTTFSLDGRSIFGENDYQFRLGLKKEETYFLRLNLENFRTWSNGDGGYHPPTGFQYSLSNHALALDRGEISLEGGLTLSGWPGLRFKYSHLFREGEKGSTGWGQAHPGFATTLNPPVQGLVPTVLDIDESRHILEFDLTDRIKSIDVGFGAIYEFGDLNNARRISQFPGEPAVAGVPQDRKITHRDNSSYDLLNFHAFGETWLKPNLFFSAGFMFTDLDNDTVGNRVWGDNFEIAFVPNAGNGQGYTNLFSTARKHDYVLNLNLMSQATKSLTITPSIRVERQDWNADSSAFSTFGNSLFAATGSAADADALEVRERLDIRYGGLTNWVLTAQGEWTQGQGNVAEFGGIFNTAGAPGTPLQRETEETRFYQKYSLGAKWYATRRFSIDVGAYYKNHNYDYDHSIDSTANNSVANRYPAYLTLQNFATHDGNARVTWRPLANLTLVSRYEYQLSKIDTTPDPISGLAEAESAELTSHVFAQNVSWSPWSRLSLQCGLNYVTSELRTPASDLTGAILEAQNNYWSANLNASFVLDEQTDLNVGYSYYRADDYTDNSALGVPYGSGAEEHGINASLSRRITENLRATVRYGYYTYTDDSAGPFRDFDAHIVTTSLQYRF